MESSMSISRTDLAAEIGFFNGWGRGIESGDKVWNTRQQQAIDSYLASGLHKFYYPPILPGERVAHEWSFLKPSTDLTVESGASAATLPADFGGLSGAVIMSSPTGQRCGPVAVIGVGMLDDLYARVDGQTGTPQFVAIRPLRGTQRDRGQRFELAVYPTADQDYVLRMAYTLAPNVLTAQYPYPYGGPVHRETLLEACLSVAEARGDNNRGIHEALFMTHLQAGVSHDRKFRPQLIGYNGNGYREPVGSYQYDNRLVTVDNLYST